MVAKAYLRIKHRPQANNDNGRLKFLSVIFLVVAILIVIRLFDLQILKGDFYRSLAADQYELYKKLFPQRGSIYVREKTGDKTVLYPLVSNQTMYLIYASPREIENATATAVSLLEIIGLPEDTQEKEFAESNTDLIEALNNSTSTDLSGFNGEQVSLLQKWIDIFNNKERAYYPLRDRVDYAVIEKLKSAGLAGVGWTEKAYRYYTENGLGGQLFGFWGYDGDERVGKYGLEGYFDDALAGQVGEIKSERDSRGNLIALGDNLFKEKIDGSDLVLTINRSLQYVACQELKKSIDRNQAKGGVIIVMEPDTGAILAMCSFPDYNPDKYFQVDEPKKFNNRAIFDAYEPGSIFKPITIASAIDAGKVSADTYYTDTGVVDYGQHQIRNFENKSYGYVNMTRVLEYSINTGVIYAMRQMGVSSFIDYVKKFGFGQATGIDLQRESVGNINNLTAKGEIHQATISFGQGITATPIQMINAFSAIINGGKLMNPYVVSEVISDNKVVKKTEPQVIRQVISPKTSLTMRAILVSVVENGHVKKAQIEGYRVGGKTGTAQVPDGRGGYKSDLSVIGSFVGFAPFNNPKVAILVRVDEPQSNRTGEGVAVPVFVEVAKFALKYYNIPRDK